MDHDDHDPDAPHLLAAGHGTAFEPWQTKAVWDGIHETEARNTTPYMLTHVDLVPTVEPKRLLDIALSIGSRPHDIEGDIVGYEETDGIGWATVRLPQVKSTSRFKNSGPSIGATQTDLGVPERWTQAKELVAAMQKSGYLKLDEAAAEEAFKALTTKGDPSVLVKNGLAIKINRFANSPAGRALIDRWDNDNRRAAANRVLMHAIGTGPLAGRGVLDPSHPDHVRALKLLGAVANNQPSGDYNWLHAFQAIREMEQPTLDDMARALWKIEAFSGDKGSGRNILTTFGIPIPLWIPEAPRRKSTLPPAGTQPRPEPAAPLPPGGPADAMPPLLAPPGGPTGPGPLGTSLPAGPPAGSMPLTAPVQPSNPEIRGQEASLFRGPAGVPFPAAPLPGPGYGHGPPGAGFRPVAASHSPPGMGLGWPFASPGVPTQAAPPPRLPGLLDRIAPGWDKPPPSPLGLFDAFLSAHAPEEPDPAPPMGLLGQYLFRDRNGMG